MEENARRGKAGGPAVKTEAEFGGCAGPGKRKRSGETRVDRGKQKVKPPVLGEKFQCPQCPKSYRWRQGLRKHAGDEHGPRVLCKYCKLPFKKSHLQKHVKKCNGMTVENAKRKDPEDSEDDDDTGVESEAEGRSSLEKMGRDLENMI